jgi:solute carrier family 35, member F1/2
MEEAKEAVSDKPTVTSLSRKPEWPWKRIFGLLLLGQTIAFLNSTSSMISEFLAGDYRAKIPCTQMLVTYGLLACVYLPWLIYKKKLMIVIKTNRWLIYAVLTLLDFEGNYLIVKAFQYTTIVSVMLLDCFTLPMVMFLSFLFFNLRFSWLHYLGVFICLVGIVILILNDITHQSMAWGENPWLGDILVVAAATCYALCNVGQEAVVKHFDMVEFLSMMGLFGTIYAAIQLCILERSAISDIYWTGPTVGLLLGFAATLFVFYSLSLYLFRWSNVTFYNLSLLASDVYGLIYGVLIFHVPVS